jgi:antitoxin (DNA-binding transcriptional repressor) of toxin-antitoxin stability system
MQRMTVSELRVKLAAVLDGISNGERIGITRDGETIAVLMPPDDAAWAATLADRFRQRRPPFTQAALDDWLEGVLAELNPDQLMATEV